MKKLLCVLVACLLLTACAGREAPDATGVANETTTPTESSAASSVPAETTTPASSDVIQETQLAFSVSDAASSVPQEDTLTRFTLYTPNDNADGFLATEVEGDKITPMNMLIEAGVLSEAILLNYVKWEADLLTADFNASFRDLLLSQGTAGEKMLMGSVVNTFLSAYQTESMMITVEGQILESGHVIYDFPMEYFE